MRAAFLAGLFLAGACGGSAVEGPEPASGGSPGSNGGSSAGGDLPGLGGKPAAGGRSFGGATSAGGSTTNPQGGFGGSIGGSAGAGGIGVIVDGGYTNGGEGGSGDPGGSGNAGNGGNSGSAGNAGSGDTGGSAPTSTCGNGIVEGSEDCDRGRENGLFYGDGSGCTLWCRVEPSCRSNGVSAACEPRCGDGNVDYTEACDDGNLDSGDGCSSKCAVESGYSCAATEYRENFPCTGAAASCTRVGITFRDFDGAHAPIGHPDFFFMSATVDGQKTTCVPNASGANLLPQAANGSCPPTDATEPCTGLVAPALDANGRPALNTSRANGSTCKCTFTDWDNTGILSGATGTLQCSSGAQSPKYVKDVPVKMIQSADSFAQWFADSALSTRTRAALALASSNGEQSTTTDSPRTIADDLHDIWLRSKNLPVTANVTTLSSGFFPLESSDRPKICNLSPYWRAPANCIAADGATVWQQWDARAWNSGGAAPQPNEVLGAPVQPVTGMPRNFYFTSEAHALFRFKGNESITFTGDDDVWVFVNGHLLLDLGGTHERMRGTITLSANGATADWSKGIFDPHTDALLPLPGTAGSGTISSVGLELERVYEIAIFQADRQPRESNYALTLPVFRSKRSVCSR